jgi:hypothetical protein
MLSEYELISSIKITFIFNVSKDSLILLILRTAFSLLTLTPDNPIIKNYNSFKKLKTKLSREEQINSIF